MTGQRIVSASGIRGIVGSGLDPETVARYGAAFGHVIRGEHGPGRILLARDSRTSGELLARAAAAGLQATGHDVVSLGICPTPTALLSVQDDPEALGGLVITASHNPAEWNGLKLIGADGLFLSPASGRDVQARFEEGPSYAAWDGVGAYGDRGGAAEHHVERILGLDLVDAPRIRDWAPTVAVDCVRGAGGVVLPALLERLGCRVAGMDLEPDGRFPRDPEPRPENLTALGARVREASADLGLAVDPDGDRLAVVDRRGLPLGEESTLALAVELVLTHDPGPVVTNLSTSQLVEEVARRHGQPVHRTPVGEANVAAGMARHGAPVGGEGNGGVMLAALHATRDAPLAAALILGLRAERGRDLREIVSEWPEYQLVKGKAPRPERPLEEAFAAVRRSAPEGAEEDLQDGLRLSWPAEKRWLHLRPSGTEPVVRIMTEAPEKERAEALARLVREALADMTIRDSGD